MHGREQWDTQENRGLDKIFRLRTVYSDRMFLEHFPTEEIVHFIWGRKIHPRSVEVLMDRAGRTYHRNVLHHFNGSTHTATDLDSGSTRDSRMKWALTRDCGQVSR